MLASAPAPGIGGRGPGAQPDLGTASRARRADAAPAMVRILAVPGDAGRPAPPNTGQPATLRGLGFLVDGRGYVLTHTDVIRDGKGLEAVLADKEVRGEAGVAGSADPRRRPRMKGAICRLPLGDSGGVQVGDTAPSSVGRRRPRRRR